MYIPIEFAITDTAQIESFLQDNPFGILVLSVGLAEPQATHIPFLIRRVDDGFILEGHMAKNNPQSQQLAKGKSVLAIFSGPHAYVSASVYQHENVSTWNYQAVHIYGTIKVLTEEDKDLHLQEILHHFENGRDKALSYRSLSQNMLDSYKQEIVAFRIRSYRVEAAFKLSQNRTTADKERIIQDLSKNEEHSSLVQAMKKSD